MTMGDYQLKHLTFADPHLGVPGPTILEAEVGSRAHDLHLPEKDDQDLMGVCIEPPEYIIGFKQFEQAIYRTAEEREPAKDGHAPKSRPGDIDMVIYGLKKFCRLALKGNPTTMILFWTPQHRLMRVSESGRRLLEAYPDFLSKRIGRAFLGYLQEQRDRLLGLRGQKRINRPELDAEHGFDTKYAMHMLRLGYQGVEFLQTGGVTLPMRGSNRDTLLAVRKGEVVVGSILMIAESLEKKMKELLETADLPCEPNVDRINNLLIELYAGQWSVVMQGVADA